MDICGLLLVFLCLPHESESINPLVPITSPVIFGGWLQVHQRCAVLGVQSRPGDPVKNGTCDPAASGYGERRPRAGQAERLRNWRVIIKSSSSSSSLEMRLHNWMLGVLQECRSQQPTICLGFRRLQEEKHISRILTYLTLRSAPSLLRVFSIRTGCRPGCWQDLLVAAVHRQEARTQ